MFKCLFTHDEKGKLWVITDGGRLVKFKRPGKMSYDFQISDYDLIHPRLAVMDDKVFITDRDAIMPLDALQMAMDQEAAEAEE